MTRDPDVGLLFDVFVASERVGALLRQALRGAAIAPSHYAVLSFVKTAGPSTPGAITEATGLQKSTLSGHLSALERTGLVSREPGEDGRSAMIRLTEAGARVHLGAERAVRDLWSAASADVDVPATRALLGTLIDALEGVTRA